MDNQDIHRIIVNAEIGEVCNPHTGDCVSVAVAIKEVFGGYYLCGYQTPIDTVPAHATVDINGVLFDGSGRTSTDALYDIAISGLKSDEIYSFDEHIGEVSELTGNQLFDEETKTKVKNRLVEQKERYNQYE